MWRTLATERRVVTRRRLLATTDNAFADLRGCRQGGRPTTGGDDRETSQLFDHGRRVVVSQLDRPQAAGVDARGDVQHRIADAIRDSCGFVTVGAVANGDLRLGKRGRKVAWSDSLPTLHSCRGSPPLVPVKDGTESGESICASRLWDNTDWL